MVTSDRKKHYPLQQGFMIIEAVIVTCVLVSLMSLGSRYITQHAERTVNKITAQQLRQVTKAAQHYVQDHYSQFQKNPNQKITWQDLVNEGYLSTQSPEKNNYGQEYLFSVTDQKGLLQLLLTTDGGHPISESSLRQIAAMAGSSAGYASELHKNKITGHQESWFLNSPPLNIGHLASLTMVNEKEVMDAAIFLRRTQLVGHPEYNRMEADLEIKEHLLKIIEGSAQTQLSPTTLTLDNPVGSAKTKNISLDVKGEPTLKMKDSYNPINNGAESLMSSDRLELIRPNEGNEIKLTSNDDPSITIKKSNANIKLNADELLMHSSYNAGSINMILNSWDSSDLGIHVTVEKVEPFWATAGWSRGVHISPNWLRLPVYKRNHDSSFGSTQGKDYAIEVCNRSSRVEYGMETHIGRLFVVTNQSTGNTAIWICTTKPNQPVLLGYKD